jgi:hypothetical protein
MLIILHHRENGAAMVNTLGENSEFNEVNVDDDRSLKAALLGMSFLQYILVPGNCG